MRASDNFNETIKAFLETRAQEDELFRIKYEKVNRPIEEITAYILSEVYASGVCGMSDMEVFNLAIHAAEEENIEIKHRNVAAQVVVNHQVELSEEEKAECRRAALRQYQQEQVNRLREREASKRSKTTKDVDSQPNLFDF